MEELSSSISNEINFNGINVMNSTITLVKIENKLQNKDIDQYITFNDLNISDIRYEFQTSIIVTEDIKSDQIFKIIFNRPIMKNLYFVQSSLLFSLRHQCNEQLEINLPIFTGIRFGRIYMRVHTQSSEINTNVLMNNVTASNIDAALL